MAKDSSRLAQAVAHHQAGRLAEAEQGYRAALSADPQHPDALHLLGVLSLQSGRADEAVALIGKALERSKGVADYWDNLGSALRAAGRAADAIQAHRSAATLDPGGAQRRHNLGNALAASGRHDEAERAYSLALALKPDYAKAWYNLGNGRAAVRRHADAAVALDRAVRLSPGMAEAHNNLGNTLQALGRFDEAAACFEDALARQPDLASATYGLSLLALRHGDLPRGWTGYERRFAAGEATPDRRIAAPRWKGEVLRGKRLMIWREQGVGHEILFASCYPDVIAWAGGPVVIECDPRLVPLFSRSFPKATVRAESCTGDAFGGGPRETIDPPDYDLQAPAGDLPHRLRESLSAFEPQGAWLVPDPALVEHWRARLAALGPGLRVGIGWRGQEMTADRKASYVMLEHWGPLFALPGVVFVNLQHGDCDAELAAAEARFGVRIHRWDDLDLKDDFDGAAALTANLDLVISPAMSAGELAGALGVPVWRFGHRDWTQLGTGVRPWFPSMRLFQPNPGEGLETTMQAIAGALRAALPEGALPQPAQSPTPPVAHAAPPPPADFDALLNHAVALHRAGHAAEAEAGYRAALAADPARANPGHADALHLLGLLLHQSGNSTDALDFIAEALRLDPVFPHAWNHLGLIHEAEKQHAEASRAFARALALHPAFPEALTHLGLAHQTGGHQTGGQVAEAMRLHRRSIAVQPENPPAFANLGHACELAGRSGEATAHYRRALALQPDSADAHNNLATMAMYAGRQGETRRHLQYALRIAPNFALAAWNLGLIDLTDGKLDRGWEGYARRFSARQLQRARRIDRPQWNGESLRGRRLLVWSEQGVGDEILFASCFDALRELDGPVTVECDRRLVSLFARSFPGVSVRAETTDAAGRETVNPPDCDLQMPAGSLPALIRDRLDRFPSRPAFLRPDPELLALWRNRVAALPGLRVGLAWRSQIVTAQRAASYTGLADWLPLLDLPGVSVVTLQYGDCAAELARVETASRRLHRWDDLNLKDDFEGVSALIANLDLVISPATAVGELAGALGVPIWRLGSRDWTQLGAGVRPWYPSMRLIQPGPGEGMADATVKAVRALTALAPA